MALLRSIAVAASFFICNHVLAADRSLQIGLDGLVCAFCAQGVEKKIKAQSAADQVFVSLDKKVAVVGLKRGQDIADETIRKEIADAGYVVTTIARTDEAFDKLTARIKAAK